MVAWLGECYASEWHLFRDAPDQTTAGFYYFAEEDAQPLPGLHYFGSRNWNEKGVMYTQGLGEDLHTPHAHRSGQFPGPKPVSRIVGNLDCINNGDLVADAADPETLINGYPELCYRPVEGGDQVDVPTDFVRAGAFSRCQTARLWATVIEWMYINRVDQIDEVLSDFFLEAPTVTFHPPAQLFPAVLTVVGAGWCAVILDGTRSAQQIATQAFQTFQKPVNFGIFGTAPLWYDAATYALNLLIADGVNDRRPVFFAGHSYGAAVALVLAARFRNADADRPIRYMTFACPKPGDVRLHDLVLRCGGGALCNHEDIVTALPPDRPAYAQVVDQFVAVDFTVYDNWHMPPISFTQYDDGRLVAGYDVPLTFPVLFNAVARAHAGEAWSDIFAHTIGEYVRRIAIRCPGVVWPVNADVVEDLDTAVGTSVIGLTTPSHARSLVGLSHGFIPGLFALALAKQEVNFQVFSTPGAMTWTAPSGITSAVVFALGGGGRGGTSTDDTWGGGGGGGGGSCIIGRIPVTAGHIYAGRVGDGGHGGGTDTFLAGDGGSQLRAGGGFNGVDAFNASGQPGGAGGTPSVTPPATTFFHFGHLLLGDGSDLLLADGSFILLPSDVPFDGGHGGHGLDNPGFAFVQGGGGGGAAGYYGDGTDGADGAAGSAGGVGSLPGGDGGDGNNGGGGLAVPGWPIGGGGGGNGYDDPLMTFGANGQLIVAWFGAAVVLSHLLLADGSDLLLADGTLILLG